MQHYPNLIHGVPIEVVQISKATTYYDPDTREPIQQASRSATVIIPGQPRVRSADALNMDSRGGDRPQSDGYVLFRKRDLDALGVTLQLNDKIIKIGHIEQELFINRLEWIGQLQDYGGSTLVKAWYIDRRPSKYSNYGN